jgi:multicomponent Na+:H+ antiporter subunit E
VAVPLDVKTNLEITVLSSLISLTPGTLSLDVSEDRSHLFVHAMYIPHGDADRLRNEIKMGFERRVLKIFN